MFQFRIDMMRLVIAVAIALQLCCTPIPSDRTTGSKLEADSGPDAWFRADDLSELPDQFTERCYFVGHELCAKVEACCPSKPVESCLSFFLGMCDQPPGKYTAVAEAARTEHWVPVAGSDALLRGALEEVSRQCNKHIIETIVAAVLFAWIDPANVGEPCASSVGHPVCAVGLGHCFGPPYAPEPTCFADAAAGEKCGGNTSCKWPNVCRIGPTEGTCQETGGSCDSQPENQSSECFAWQQCNSGTCVTRPPIKVGGFCSSSADCGAFQVCADSQCAAEICDAW